MQPLSRPHGLLLVVSSLALLPVGGCSPPSDDILASQLPAILQPLPGASSVEARKLGGSAAIHYEVVAVYPATEALAELGRRIPASWEPRREDFMNPGIPTSHVRGWTDYRDNTTTPHSWVHRWSAEWQNPAGDILSYDLTYRSPATDKAWRVPEAPTTDRLRIIGSLIPRAKVAQIQRFHPLL